METCTAFNIFCTIMLLTFLHISGQITVSIEAMCSASSAGLRWAAHTGIPSRIVNSIDISFNCTSPSMELTSDECFQKDNLTIFVQQLREPHLTHTIGKQLETGTVCTFVATAKDNSGQQLDTVSAGCTVNGSAAVLPAQCSVSSDTQECLCSCSQGYIERTRTDPYMDCVLAEPSTTQVIWGPTPPARALMLGPSYEESSASTVTIEAMCSSDNAGLRWITTHSDVYTIEVGFDCTSPDNVELSTDRCFEEPQTYIIVNWRPEPEGTHIIGTKLESGTACKFKATTYDGLNGLLNRVSASCTVGRSAAPLPAQCDINNATQTCQCSCSPGYTERSGRRPSLECDPIEQLPATTAVKSEEHQLTTGDRIEQLPATTEMESEKHQGDHIEQLLATTAIKLPRVTSTSTVPHTTPTHTPISILLEETLQFTRQALSTTPTQLAVTPTPTPSTHRSPIPGNKLLSTFSLFAIPATVFTILLVCIGAACYQKIRLKRIHDRMALPFESLKHEKIDPDFNPVEIEVMTFRSVSIPSVFHILDLNPVTQATHNKDSYDSTNSEGLEDSDYKQICYNSHCNESSGYLTESTQREAIDTVNDYLISSVCNPSPQECTDSVEQGTPPADYILPITDVSFDFPASKL